MRVLLIEESCATVVNRLRRAGAINSQPAQSLVHEDAPVILVVGVASLIGLIQQDALPADRFIDLIRREKLLMIVEEPIDSVINSIGVIRPDLTELMRLLVSLGMVIDIALSLPSDWMRPLNGWLNLHGLTPPRATERVRFEEIASLVHEANPNRMIVFAAAGMTVTRYQMSLID
ncbi:hypothetical protein HGA91_02485 [candidate division WWE3 bacterium]|nr:hypothetical protein [candidate division WWE3 bacterium]